MQVRPIGFEGDSCFFLLSLSGSLQVAVLCPACLYASLPGGFPRLVPACCFMWHRVTDLMTCDLAVHLAIHESGRLFIYFLL